MIENVVFIPSQLQTADLWEQQTEAGKDDWRSTVANHATADTVEGIASAVLSDAPTTFSLTALGMGGFIAMEMLRQQPDRITKLMLVSTLASADSDQQTRRRMHYLELVKAGNFAAVVEERLSILVHPQRRRDLVLMARIRKMAFDTGPEAFLRQQRAIMSRPDSRLSLHRITCPTLIVFGREDGITAVSHQQEMLAAIPGAQLEIIEQCGHVIPFEQPKQFTQLFRDWNSL